MESPSRNRRILLIPVSQKRYQSLNLAFSVFSIKTKFKMNCHFICMHEKVRKVECFFVFLRHFKRGRRSLVCKKRIFWDFHQTANLDWVTYVFVEKNFTWYVYYTKFAYHNTSNRKLWHKKLRIQRTLACPWSPIIIPIAVQREGLSIF